MKVSKAILKQALFLLMWYPLRKTIRFVPLRMIGALGRIGGGLLWLLAGERRDIMAAELAKVLPDFASRAVKRLVRDSFAQYCTSEIEVLFYPMMNKSFMDRLVIIEGREHLDAALAKGRGVLLFQAHFGAFQMVMPAVGYSGYPMSQISASASTWKDDSTSSWVERKCFRMKAAYERTLPVRHIAVQSSLRPVFRALAGNEIVGVTVDGGGGRKVIPIPFLGRRSYFQRGGVELALRTGAEIVPAFIVTENGLKHRLTIHPPIAAGGGPDREEDVRSALTAFASLLEGYVLKHPAHYGYTLFLRRFRATLDEFPFFADYDEDRSSAGRNTI